jgi:hypothetical protein
MTHSHLELTRTSAGPGPGSYRPLLVRDHEFRGRA